MEKTENLPLLEKKSDDFYLCYAGRSRCLPLHNYGPVVRPTWILHYILEGEGTFWMEDVPYHLSAAQGFVVPPDVNHRYQADQYHPWSYIWIAFDGVYAAEYIQRLGLSRKNPVFFCEHNLSLRSIVEQMLQHNCAGFSHEMFLQGLLYQFFGVLAQSLPAAASVRGGGKQADYVARAMEFIRHNYSQGIFVSDVAEYVGINRSYLFTLFQEHLHQSPQEYLTNFKIRRACELLRTTEYSLENISRSCGYKDAVVFSKAFKQVMGLAPGQYRKQHFTQQGKEKKHR